MTPGGGSWRRGVGEVLAAMPDRKIAARAGEVRAAVLVPMLETGEQLELVLERRADDLPNHAGQFAFPGGAVDPEDGSAEEAALREAWEEIGLQPEQVEILGLLPDIRTPTGYVITPVVGAVGGPVELRPFPGEVARLLTVPVAVLLNGGAFRPVLRRSHGLLIRSTALEYRGDVVWGATARILLSLRRVLRRVRGPWRSSVAV